MQVCALLGGDKEKCQKKWPAFRVSLEIVNQKISETLVVHHKPHDLVLLPLWCATVMWQLAGRSDVEGCFNPDKQRCLRTTFSENASFGGGPVKTSGACAGANWTRCSHERAGDDWCTSETLWKHELTGACVRSAHDPETEQQNTDEDRLAQHGTVTVEMWRTTMRAPHLSSCATACRGEALRLICHVMQKSSLQWFPDIRWTPKQTL